MNRFDAKSREKRAGQAAVAALERLAADTDGLPEVLLAVEIMFTAVLLLIEAPPERVSELTDAMALRVIERHAATIAAQSATPVQGGRS